MSNDIDEILRKIETLRKNGMFAQAIDAIQAGLRKESGDFRLLTAYGKLAFESRDAKRADSTSSASTGFAI